MDGNECIIEESKYERVVCSVYFQGGDWEVVRGGNPLGRSREKAFVICRGVGYFFYYYCYCSFYGGEVSYLARIKSTLYMYGNRSHGLIESLVLSIHYFSPCIYKIK